MFERWAFFAGADFWPWYVRAATDRYVRKRGRPRNEYAIKLYSEVSALVDRPPALILDQVLKNEIEFERRLCMYIIAWGVWLLTIWGQVDFAAAAAEMNQMIQMIY